MLLISLLTRKLDPYTNRAYHLDRVDPDQMPTMAEFIAFLLAPVKDRLEL